MRITEQTGVEKCWPLLLVEDDAAITRILTISLRSGGFDVTGAGSGEEALRVMENQAFDAVVLDLGLPDGRGSDVLERLRQGVLLGCPAWIVISALDEEDATRRYGPLNAPFLRKPFDPWDLVRTLKELLLQRDCREETEFYP